jgi:hypothetical protein
MLYSKRSLIFLCLFLAGCSLIDDIAPPPTPSTPFIPTKVSEAVLFDAEHMAEEYNISTETALEWMFLVDAAGNLNAQLEEQEADTFAGLWILHEPEPLVVVSFTRDGEKTIRPYLENTPLAGRIELRSAEATYRELVSAEIKANQLVRQLGLSLVAMTMINIEENQAEIHISDRALLDTRLREAGLALPEHVEVIVPESQPEAAIPPQVTPAAGIFFPQLTFHPAIIYPELGTGTVILKDSCLRMDGTEESALLIWLPNHYLNDNQGVIEVLNSSGEPVARVGELSCFSRVAGDAAEAVDQFISQPLPESCGPPYLLVGDIELAYKQEQSSDLVNIESVSTEGNPFYFLQAKPAHQDWLAEQEVITGRLVLEEGSRCLRLRDWDRLPGDVMLLWPLDAQACSDGGAAAICDAAGQVIARLGQQVHLRGSYFLDGDESRMAVNDALPCDCVGGAYFVVVGMEN